MYYKKLNIIEKKVLNKRYFIITFRDEEIAENALPGQFCQLKLSYQSYPVLPRPFSIYKAEGSKFSFLIKIVGNSTQKLSKKQEGDQISVLGPLGKGFQLVQEKQILLVSGGIGYAPLHFLKQKLVRHNHKVIFLHGCKDKFDVFNQECINYTEDGSVGEMGLVTTGIEKLLQENEIDLIYACGPNPMLKKVSEICLANEVELQVSLETMMACGMGVCCGCVIKFRENNEIIFKKACKDGPVFNGKKVIWDD